MSRVDDTMDEPVKATSRGFESNENPSQCGKATDISSGEAYEELGQ